LERISFDRQKARKQRKHSTQTLRA